MSRVASQMVTRFSSIASRSADCTFGGVRLISSARRIFVKTGHFLVMNSAFCGRYISFPVRSDGSRSGVNDTRFVSRPRTLASVRMVFVFPSPGTHSMSACPHENTVIMSFFISSSCPMISFCTSFFIALRVSYMWVRAGLSIKK